MNQVVMIRRHTRRTRKGKVVVVDAHRKLINTKPTPKRKPSSTIELPFGKYPKKNYAGCKNDKRAFSITPMNKKQAILFANMGIDTPTITDAGEKRTINDRVGPREVVPIKVIIPIDKKKQLQRHKEDD